MKKAFLFLLLLFLTTNVHAGCDDPIADGVDYTNCRFSEGQDLKGSYLPNSNLSFASFIQVNFNKSIMMNSILAFGMFSESTFIRANLYESNFQGANFEKSDFTSANLTRAKFTGSTLIATALFRCEGTRAVRRRAPSGRQSPTTRRSPSSNHDRAEKRSVMRQELVLRKQTRTTR